MNGITTKGGGDTQIQIALGNLLEAATDKNGLVSETINTCLRKIAKKHPNDVLQACCHFNRQNKLKEGKQNTEHIGIILKIMEDICREHIVAINGDTIMLLVDLCLELMTQNVAYEPLVQMPASDVLVALGSKHCIQIVDALCGKLSAGVVPHYTIPHTLGSLASANAFGVVPYLKTILGIMLPLLATLKQDAMRQSFAYSLGRFSDAIVEYCSNPEQAPDPSIIVANFHIEMSMAYDVLFSVWLHAREPKLIETVLYALASMFNILSAESVRLHTHKSIQVLLQQYRKHKEYHWITKCLGSIISVASKTDGTLLETQLGNILHTLSDLVCVTPDYAQPELLRTHSEVLRCYECLCLHYTDHTMDHVLAQVKNDKERIKGLVVLTHLTNAADGAIQNRLKDILLVIDSLMVDTHVRVKRALMKCIVALAYKGFLINKDVPTEKFLQYIVRLCCKQPSVAQSESYELSELKQTADNTLYMLSTSVKELETILWQLLLKCLLIYEYHDACIVLLRCLTNLASRKSCKESCTGAFVRCLALLAHPLEGFRGTFILNFLRNVNLCDTEVYKPVWDSRVPHLQKYLEQNYDSFSEKEWEDLVFDFLNTLLDVVKDGVFQETLVSCVSDQLPLYLNRPSDPETALRLNVEKSFLLKCLAIIACHISDKKMVEKVIDMIMFSVKSNDINELQSCAKAIGICSRAHMKIVLEKLREVRKGLFIKKNNTMFNLPWRDQKNEDTIERLRYVVVASYADISNEAPVDLLRLIQTEVIDFVLEVLALSKDFGMRRICLKALGSAADALHPNRNTLHVQLQDRDKILQIVAAQLQLHSGPEYIELFPVIIPVLTSLIKLPNVLETEARLQLLKLCFDNVFNASAIYCKLNSAESYGDLKLTPHVYASFSKVNLLVQELLVQCISPATLDEVFTLLEPWLGRKKLEQRLPALEALRTALQTYLDNMRFAYDAPSSFGQTGLILARIIPRCTDPNKNTRKVAVECVCLVLCISGRYEGHMRDHDKLLSNSLLHIQEQIDTEDPKLLFNLITDLAHVIGSNVPKFQIAHFVEALIDGLLDVEASSSSGTSVVLNTVIKLNGGDLQQHVAELLEKMLGILDKIKCTRTKGTALCAVLSFAQHHIKPVVAMILQQPLPYDSSTCSCWSVLATDSTLIVEIFDQLKKILKTSTHYEVQKNAENLRIATLRPLQAICGLSELFKSNESHDLCKQQFPDFFSILYISLASYIDTAAPLYSTADNKKSHITNREAYKLVPFKICLDTFQQFLKNADSPQSALNLNSCGHSLESFLDIVSDLTENVCSEYPQSLAWLVACLGPYIRSELEPQRVAVSALFAALLKHKLSNETVLAENVLEMLLDIQNDSSCVVRKLSIKGLGYAAEFLSPELVLRHCNNILNALMHGLDYNNTSESEVALQAMLSFSKMINVVDSVQLGQSQVTAAVRIKPLLQHDSSAIREASFLLLGDLAASIGPDDAFKEQIHGNLVTLLLHLCDEDKDVVKASKYTMRKIGPLLDCPKVNSMIQEHLLDEATLHFTHFCTDIVKAMSESMQESFPQLIMTCLSFYKSTWTEIRANGALLSGLLYSQTTAEFRPSVSIDTLSYRLLQLLKDGQPDVRIRAAEALAFIFTT